MKKYSVLILSLIFGMLFFFFGNAQKLEKQIENVQGDFNLPNLIAPLDYEDFLKYKTNASDYLPIADNFFFEHIRSKTTENEEFRIKKVFESNLNNLKLNDYVKLVHEPITALQENNGGVWIGTNTGLFYYNLKTKVLKKHNSYGIDGPLSTSISDIALDSKGTMWVGTPIGLSLLKSDGTWHAIQGREGLPVEDITTLLIDKFDAIWIGTSQGAILYKPYDNGRKWYYRAGKRYLINNHIQDITLTNNDKTIFFKTDNGISKLDVINQTLSQRANSIENRLNKWHRRNGLVASSILNDAENPISYTIKDNDNDGLWTSYHVVAMSLAFATTGEEKYRLSAKTGMDAMIMLQNVSGIPGIVARSIVPISQKSEMSEQWRETPDGKLLWKSDTSSDEIDGHFFAFYAYWEHIAKQDPKESKRIKKQINTLMHYIVDNNYQLIDWDGKRTKWGFWNPELLNDDPENYTENGLNSAQILSFLKVSYYITGDKKFKNHYDYLITKHGYLTNIMLEKKVFPDLNNHSDNQLGFVALYPLLQLENDPKVKNVLQRTVRRHYRTLSKDGSAFFYFVAATIDPDYVDIDGAVVNLRQIPTDRRQWTMVNSNRKDIIWNTELSRFNRKQLLYVLPADERNFDRWNRNPYAPDAGKGGKFEDDGGSWLLAYWLGRYHGFINKESK